MYLAHISEDRSREQTLKDHLEETAKPDFYSFTLKIKLYSSRIPEKSTFLGFFSIFYIRYALIVL